MAAITPLQGGSNLPLEGGGKKFFTVGIFIKRNTSKYAKLMVEPYICDNLNQIYD